MQFYRYGYYSRAAFNGAYTVATITPGPSLSGSVDNSDSENRKVMSSNNLQKKVAKSTCNVYFCVGLTFF